MQRTEVCNFADDNTLYSCASSIDAVISDLEVDMENSFVGLKLTNSLLTQRNFSLCSWAWMREN